MIHKSIVEELGLSAVKDGSLTFFHAQKGGLFPINFIIGTPDTLQDFTWVVNSGSTEAIIYVTLSNLCDAPRLSCWRLDKVDLFVFERLITFARDVDDFLSIDAAIDCLVSVLYTADLAAVPLTRGQLSGVVWFLGD